MMGQISNKWTSVFRPVCRPQRHIPINNLSVIEGFGTEGIDVGVEVSDCNERSEIAKTNTVVTIDESSARDGATLT